MPLRESERGQLVIVLRDPTQRLISAFLNKMRVEPDPAPGALSRGRDRDRDRTSTRRRLSAVNNATKVDAMRVTMRGLRTDAERFNAYVNFTGGHLCDEHCMLGCQTKMVLGFGCNQNVDVSRRIDEAKSIIEAALFVGLTDHWLESVCLWHQMMHDAGPAFWPNEFQNERPGRLSETKLGRGAYNVSAYGVRAGQVVDPLDQKLYEHGRAVFLRNLDAFSACDVAVRRCDVADTARAPTGSGRGASPSEAPKGRERPRKVGRADPAAWRC